MASGASRYGPAALTPAAIVGRTVFTADGSTVYAFAEPADGWSGTVHPSARLRIGGPRDATSAIAASGRNVIASTPNNAIRVFTEPERGWTRTVQPTTTLHPPRHGLFGFSGAVAISQRTIVAASMTGRRSVCFGLDSRITPARDTAGSTQTQQYRRPGR